MKTETAILKPTTTQYYRAVNFPIDDDGNPVCPNGKKFSYIYSKPVKGNKYGRTEEYYQCEDFSGCPHKQECCKCKGNRIIRLNEELTQFHQEVLKNLNSIHGALLRMNRSIQAEGTYGTIKWNRSYTRMRRRGLKALVFEVGLICCGFNLHKFHLKKLALKSAGGCIINRVNAKNNHEKIMEENGMKARTQHGLSEKEMELAKYLMTDCKTTGDIQAKLKRL